MGVECAALLPETVVARALCDDETNKIKLFAFSLESSSCVIFDVFQPPLELDEHPELWPGYYLGSFTEEVELSGPQTTLNQKPSSLQKPIPFQPNQAVINSVNTALANPGCFDFLSTVLNKASTKSNPVLYGGDMTQIFRAFLAQKNGGMIRGSLGGAPYGSGIGKIGCNGAGNAVVYSNPTTDQDRDDASTIINELPHLAGAKGGWPNHHQYDDLQLARATVIVVTTSSFGSFLCQILFQHFQPQKCKKRIVRVTSGVRIFTTS